MPSGRDDGGAAAVDGPPNGPASRPTVERGDRSATVAVRDRTDQHRRENAPWAQSAPFGPDRGRARVRENGTDPAERLVREFDDAVSVEDADLGGGFSSGCPASANCPRSEIRAVSSIDDPVLSPNAGSDCGSRDDGGDGSDCGSAGGRDDDTGPGIDRRRLLAGGAAVGLAATAGCLGGSDGGAGPTEAPTVFAFNTGDGTVSVVDAEADEVVGTRSLGLSSSFPSNQYTPALTDEPADPLWLNVGRGVRALSVGSLSVAASVETGSGANWQEQTPDGAHLVVSAREPAHRNLRVDADPASGSFGEVTGELDRTPEGGRGDSEGPGPCDVTVHPDGEFAYVPDLFADTLTVLRVDPFEVATQVEVPPVGDGPAAPWMGTVSPDGETLLVEHDEGRGTESVWDVGDPASPELRARLTGEDGLGRRPLTSEVGPDSETGYVFTPGSEDVTVLDLPAGEVTDRIDLGGAAFVGTWNPAHTKLYVPVQTSDEVAVIDHGAGAVVDRLPVGPKPYGATAATVRPPPSTTADLETVLAQLGLKGGPAETTYCIGNCACGHRL